MRIFIVYFRVIRSEIHDILNINGLFSTLMLPKPELLQLNHTQFICLRNFINKRVGFQIN